MAESSIRKVSKDLTKREKDLKIVRETNKCECLHHIKNNPTLARKTIPARKLIDDPDHPGQKIEVVDGTKKAYVCDQCTKDINLKQHSLDEIANALKVVDDVIDAIKLAANPDSEDERVVKQLAKTQYRVRNDIMPLYKASLKKNMGDGNRNRNRGNRNDSGAAGFRKPVVGR